MHSIISTPWLLFIITFTLIHNLPPSLCATNLPYINCGKSYQCSNIYMSYPFWGNNRPQNCGHPRFKLGCTGDVPEFTIGTQGYRVLGIYNVSNTIVVGRKDYFNTVCPKSALVNTSLDFNMVSYGPTTQNVTLYYGCQKLHEVSNQFACNINGTQNNGYANFEVGGGDGLGNCSSSVIIPAFQTGTEVAANLTLLFNSGFGLHWNANNMLCNGCTTSGGQCGSKTGSTEFACYCPDGNSSSTCGGSTQGPSKIAYILITLGVSASVGAIIFLTVRNCRRGSLLGKTMVLWEKTTESDKCVDAFIRNNGSLAQKRYTYSDVKKMTNSFINVVGRGGFGCVYKGKLFDGRLVAVKVLSESKGDDGEEFINEVASISRTSHVNIVTLVGFCYERNKRALIYEFMHNGSLDKFIYDREVLNTDRRLEWKMLYQIAIGIARGLEYLHRGCTTRILHFDIKPQNILLDEDFCPKISDFGLAKLCQKKDSIVSMLGARGTAGYIAPEVFCRNFGGVSHKSDVYSYGMMVLEMVGVRKNIQVGVVRTSEIYLPHWIYEHIELGEDLKIYGVVTQEEEEVAKKMILVSLWCIQTNPTDRPSISKAVEMLEGNLQSLQVPPKPFLFSPGMSRQNSTTASLI